MRQSISLHLVLFLILIISGCNTDLGPDLTSDSPITTINFQHFESVERMLEQQKAFTVEEGTLKFISPDAATLHVQLSGKVFDSDSDEKIQNQVKRNLVWLAFRAFGETDLESFTITSVPLKMKDPQTAEGLLMEYKITEFVNRKTAVKIMEKYLGIANFEGLYDFLPAANTWIPNNNFDLLQNTFLDHVYTDLVK